LTQEELVGVKALPFPDPGSTNPDAKAKALVVRLGRFDQKRKIDDNTTTITRVAV
jgi:hypothetical protein